MIDIKFINATSVQLLDQSGNVVTNVGEFISPTEFTYSGNTFSESMSNYYHFAITGSNVQLSGVIDSVDTNYQYCNLFKGQTAITDASQLQLTALSAKNWCYANMFLDCTSLTTPPVLSATTLAHWCYSSMFGNCSSLSAVPALVATNLAKYCYFCMFYGCSSLSSAPYLSASTLADWCYNSMFFDCNRLTSISSNYSEWSPGNATRNWVTGIKTNGYFYNDNVNLMFGVDNIPQTWNRDLFNTPLTFEALEDGVAFEIAIRDYGPLDPPYKPFQYKLTQNGQEGEWTNWNLQGIELNTGDTVSIRSLQQSSPSGYGFNFMVYNEDTGTLTGANMIRVFGNIQSLNNYQSMNGSCYYYRMLDNASIIDARKLLLPDESLTPSCYMQMFNGCNNLTATPSLPASTLADSCYKEMFSGCTSLTSLYVGFTDWSTNNNATTDWVKGVQTTNGLFYGPTMLDTEYGDNFIPTNWTVTNYDETPVETNVPLTLKAVSFPVNISLVTTGSPDPISLQYSKNGGEWTNWDFSAINLSAGQTVAFSGANDHFSKDENNYYMFNTIGTGSVQASGNVMSLMNFSDSCTSGCFSWLFYSTPLLSPPQLPATTLADSCYKNMFRECISLRSAPELPATTLAWNCYDTMFAFCSRLSSAPYLPATTLTGGCYTQMFYGCSSLTSVNIALTSWTEGNFMSTMWWLSGVAANGTFTKPSILPDNERDVNHIPVGWTIVNM